MRSKNKVALAVELSIIINDDTVSTKIYDKRDDFDFDIVNFSFLNGVVSRRPSYGLYLSQFIFFARASSIETSIVVTNS